MRWILEHMGRLADYDEAISDWAGGVDPDVLLRQRFPGVWQEARRRARRIALGDQPRRRERVLQFVDAAISGKHWILLGGPPCQAYSLVGRSRNKGKKGYVPEEDERQTLYEEYLNVLAHAAPSAFVLENVKGLLSATLRNQGIFGAMLRDLQDPSSALDLSSNRDNPRPQYRLYSVVTGREVVPSGSRQNGLAADHRRLSGTCTDLSSCVVRMERYGVPQARHRIIIVGLNHDCFDAIAPDRLMLPMVEGRETVSAALEGLPPLRSGLSRQSDGTEQWEEEIRKAAQSEWIDELGNGQTLVAARIRDTIRSLEAPPLGRGSTVLPADEPTQAENAHSPELQHWYRRKGFPMVVNHEARGHMTSDLHRYLFASSYAKEVGKSPRIRDFPMSLLPDHRNVHRARRGSGYFGDRFRVQIADQPARTVTSHISKDGHYYIHPEPEQCRSLTVREAARLQTFPDDYVFLGPRTEQYRQVGNAVPPYFAAQLASSLHRLFRDEVPR